MALFIRRQNGMIFTGIVKLAIVLFVISLSFSFIDTIWAVYLDSFLHNEAFVGFISAFFTFISFLSFFFIVPIIERLDKSKMFSFSLMLFIVTYLLFAINRNFYFVIVLGVFFTILQTIRITSFGIIVRDKSSERQVSRNEGLMYTFMCTAWVIGPLIAGLISDAYGIDIIFVLAAIIIFVGLFIFKFSKVKDTNIKKKIDHNVFKNFLDFFKNKNRVIAYALGGGVNFWWTLIYIFVPLLIIRSGLHIRWVGYFLFAVAIPLIILEYKFSKLAGKIGFRKLFKIGFLIPAFLVLICFFVGNIYIILGLLVLSSFGLAMVEPTTEAYFFDVLQGKQELKFYGPYNTTIDLNHFIGRLFSAVLLLFLPFKFIFLLFSFFMFLFFLISFKTKNIIEKRRDGKNN